MKAKKLMALLLCAVLLVTGTIMGTMAYLTSEAKVVNTFTVGNVAITLDEAKVNPDGTVIPGEARVTANKYRLLPGRPYTKDPTVHVDTDKTTDDCWLFVKVENGLAKFESTAADYTPIASQIVDKGWTKLDGTDNVYWCEYEKDADPAKVNFPVFGSFTIADDANNVTGWSDIAAAGNNEGVKITVTAYAVQKAGFPTAAYAWSNTFGAPTS